MDHHLKKGINSPPLILLLSDSHWPVALFPQCKLRGKVSFSLSLTSGSSSCSALLCSVCPTSKLNLEAGWTLTTLANSPSSLSHPSPSYRLNSRHRFAEDAFSKHGGTSRLPPTAYKSRCPDPRGLAPRHQRVQAQSRCPSRPQRCVQQQPVSVKIVADAANSPR